MTYKTRNLFLICATVMVVTWVMTYLVWAYEPTPNTLEQGMRLIGLVFLLAGGVIQVGILARPLFLCLIRRSVRNAR